ncbi:MAG TPA: HAMP domain-containing sensor histidine kinase [Puia sp.]|uniref:sensor histidine kinase n=1 Tax=Puia sp. TaxID=2045100 RepID=UPI002CA52F4B|nr:HAMP domain-containing sensor histidine kinase [Puia sp.]HVU95927.1 HAMP domain-containing sensor histidine kinase [Puia sp.]
MKRLPLFRRAYGVVFLLILVLGMLFTGITYLAITNFFEASTQLLNKDVAGHIARFTSPYGREGFDRRKADSVFYDAMVISPSAEVYFLDTTGRVMYFNGKRGEIKEWQVPLEPIIRYLKANGKKHIVDLDPRDPERWKIFSAADVWREAEDTGKYAAPLRLGYIYVILGSHQFRSVSQMLFNSRITPMVLGSVSFLLAVSLLITVLYIQRMREADNIRRITASEKERRDFMINISHDLRTPLAIARGYAETLVMRKGELGPADERAYGELVVTKLRQVDQMVNQLFELSKMESASFEAHREPFVFSEMMQEVLRATDPSRRINLVNGMDGSWIFADVSMMERVVQNLVVNALAYTVEGPGGGIVVRLDSSAEELVFTIANTGAPLAEELVRWINDPDAMRPARPAIGLAIVRKILQLHGYGFAVAVGDGRNVFTVRMGLSDPRRPFRAEGSHRDR